MMNGINSGNCEIREPERHRESHVLNTLILGIERNVPYRHRHTVLVLELNTIVVGMSQGSDMNICI